MGIADIGKEESRSWDCKSSFFSLHRSSRFVPGVSPLSNNWYFSYHYIWISSRPFSFLSFPLLSASSDLFFLGLVSNGQEMLRNSENCTIGQNESDLTLFVCWERVARKLSLELNYSARYRRNSFLLYFGYVHTWSKFEERGGQKIGCLWFFAVNVFENAGKTLLAAKKPPNHKFVLICLLICFIDMRVRVFLCQITEVNIGKGIDRHKLVWFPLIWLFI